jgi:hypothetical protein
VFIDVSVAVTVASGVKVIVRVTEVVEVLTGGIGATGAPDRLYRELHAVIVPRQISVIAIQRDVFFLNFHPQHGSSGSHDDSRIPVRFYV